MGFLTTQKNVKTSYGNVHTVFAGKGARLVFFHGWSHDAYSAINIIKTLATSFSVIAPTMPGSHPSLRLHGKISTTLIQRILCEWFSKLSDEQPTILVGHSLGGVLSILLAAAEQSRIQKLYLIDSAGIPLPHTVHNWVRNWLQHRPSLYRQHGISVVKNLDRALFKNALLRFQDLRALGLFAKTTDIRPYAQQIQVPTKVIWGNDDYFIPVNLGKELSHQFIKGSFTVVPGDHYWPLFDPARLFAHLEH